MSDPITDFISLEDEQAERARQQAVVAELGQQALEGADLDSLLEAAAIQVSQALRVEFVKILELLPDEETLLLRAGVGWQDGLVGKTTVGTGLDSQAGYTLFTRQPVIVDDLLTETRFNGPKLLLKHGVVSGVSVIIQGRKVPYGVLGAHTRAHRSFSTDDVYFLKSVANVLAAAIQRKSAELELQRLNASLEQRVVERTGYLRLLHSVAMAANEATAVEPVLQFVLDRVCNFTGWPLGHVYFCVPGEGATELVPTGLWHVRDPQRFEALRQVTSGARLSPGEGLPGVVLARGEPVWFSDVRSEPKFVRAHPNAQRVADYGVRSAFATPVLIGREVVAVLEFFTDQLAEADHALLDVMAQIGAQVGRVIERARAGQELQRRQAQLAEAQRLARLGSWEWDITTNQVTWSDELYNIYGVDPQDFISSYEGFLERVHPDDRQMVMETVEKADARKEPFEYVHRIVRPDGSVRWVFGQGKPVLDEAGNLVRMVGISQDITERHRMEDALRESISLMEGLFESSPDGTVLVTESGRIVRLNRQMEILFGYDREELLGQTLEILLPERFRGKHVTHRDVYAADARTRMMGAGLELYGRRKDGSEFPVDILLSPLQTRHGLLTICVVRDISERVQAAEALRHSETRFRGVFEGAAIGMAIVDLDQRILVSNPRLQAILGYEENELRGREQYSLSHPGDLERSRQLYRELVALNRDHYQVEQRYLRRDGQVVWSSLTVSLVRDESGQPQFAIQMLEDITARKQMEAELAEVQRRLLASREQERVHLAQELHDVPMQDLYAVLYQINDLNEALASDPARLQTLDDVRATVQQVIHTLRAICGELRPPTLAPFGLEGAIREHIESFQAKYPNLKVHLELSDSGQTLPEEVSLNLFRIYQQGMNNIARHAQAQNVYIRFKLDEQGALLEVEDDGRGFEVPNRWVRLARAGHLGLVGAVERAEMIGGQFKVESAPGRGTRLRVNVPLAREGGTSL